MLLCALCSVSCTQPTRSRVEAQDTHCRHKEFCWLTKTVCCTCTERILHCCQHAQSSLYICNKLFCQLAGLSMSAMCSPIKAAHSGVGNGLSVRMLCNMAEQVSHTGGHFFSHNFWLYCANIFLQTLSFC